MGVTTLSKFDSSILWSAVADGVFLLQRRQLKSQVVTSAENISDYSRVFTVHYVVLKIHDPYNRKYYGRSRAIVRYFARYIKRYYAAITTSVEIATYHASCNPSLAPLPTSVSVTMMRTLLGSKTQGG